MMKLDLELPLRLTRRLSPAMVCADRSCRPKYTLRDGRSKLFLSPYSAIQHNEILSPSMPTARHIKRVLRVQSWMRSGTALCRGRVLSEAIGCSRAA